MLILMNSVNLFSKGFVRLIQNSNVREKKSMKGVHSSNLFVNQTTLALFFVLVQLMRTVQLKDVQYSYYINKLGKFIYACGSGESALH